MGQLTGKVAWVTGAGSGIGEAAAEALAKEGARVVLTGRRAALIEQVAERIHASGGVAEARAGDVSHAATVQRVAGEIDAAHGRVDILVNNAGGNITEREWSRLTPAGVDQVVSANLTSAYYCVTAVLPIMRRQKDGVLIHTASMAGRFISPLSGSTYTAVKHGVVAMSHTINMEECVNGIRSCAVCPGEVDTPILNTRPTPVSAEDRARMLRAADCGDLIRYIACLPPHVCINEVLITPTWNRAYVAGIQRRG
jgi:NADP-dependent 3-hydroxy acid dehydrogenase YdfG